DGIAYLEADRVHAGKVKFADMTESDRTRLGYDPDRAARHAEQQAEQERSRAAAAQRASAERQLAAAKHALQGGSEDSSPADHQTYSGTGFFVADDGRILTCAHVIEGATRITVKCQQGVFPATLVKSDPEKDLALLKVSGSFRALPVAQAGSAKLGDPVFTIGF